MHYSLFLTFIFISFIALSYSGLYNHPTEILGGTELNGNGCVCHSLDRDYDVIVWVEGPDTLMSGQTGLYKMFMAGGPAEAGGYNVAGRFGVMGLVDSLSKWDYRTPNELAQAFPLVFPSVTDTIFWEFAYTASDSSETDTIYSVGLSLIFDGIPDSLDLWNFGAKFPIVVTENVVPVELISFTALSKEYGVELKWKTSSEINNMGFELERSKVKSQNSKELTWEKIGFIEGRGTTTEIQHYSFTDDLTVNHHLTLCYRLKQIDFNGTYTYSNLIEVELNPITDFKVEQNYPNPFNPATVIGYQLSVNSFVSLKVYDLLGNEVRTLVNEYKRAGSYEADFDASGLSSGIYYYQLKAGEFNQVKKMLLVK
jgi:hypothetical protein